MRKPYTSAIRIKRQKPTTLALRHEAAELRAMLQNRRAKRADRLAAQERLNQIAPPIEANSAEPQA